MHTKNLVVVLVALVVLVIGVGTTVMYQSTQRMGAQDQAGGSDIGNENTLPVLPDDQKTPSDNTAVPIGKIKADMFTGTLESIDTGCFADGECFVVVGGKHVTALMGWTGDTVGQVIGVEGFGDLEEYIGREVEVYAQEKTDGTYTLYGSEGFYIKVQQETSDEPVEGGEGGSEPVTGDEPKPQRAYDGCMIGGCSAQLCGDAADMRDMVTTCEYRAEYACYQVATCERQSDGQCGWTMTSELTQCLRDSESAQVM